MIDTLLDIKFLKPKKNQIVLIRTGIGFKVGSLIVKNFKFYWKFENEYELYSIEEYPFWKEFS